MKQRSNSSLKYQILSTLNHKSVSSVTALAQELKAFRSSVSRAVNSLQSVGLIRREGRTLFLTEEGEEEIQRIQATLPIDSRYSLTIVPNWCCNACYTIARIFGYDTSHPINTINHISTGNEDLQ